MSINQELPKPIFSNQKGSWAYITITERLPEILERVLAENAYQGEELRSLQNLKGEIPEGPIRLLRDDDAPDLSSWQKYIQPWAGKSWLKVPWFFAEHYFYRRIMEATAYFQRGEDPFLGQKKEGLRQSLDAFSGYAAALESWLADPPSCSQMLREGLLRSLWGNQADLSLWPAGSQDAPDHGDLAALRDHLLNDQSGEVIRLLTRSSGTAVKVALMADNAGSELLGDLALIDLLLAQGRAAEVQLLVKAHPTFVSDVTADDLSWTLRSLSKAQAGPVRSLAERLESYLAQGRLIVKADFFWNSPLPMWELPGPLTQQLSGLDLLISKGDANYRRLLGDRQWDISTPFSEVVDYLPVPLTALRALKAELAVDLSLDQVMEIHNQDPSWMTDGKWAVIHFAPVSKERT